MNKDTLFTGLVAVLAGGATLKAIKVIKDRKIQKEWDDVIEDSENEK